MDGEDILLSLTFSSTEQCCLVSGIAEEHLAKLDSDTGARMENEDFCEYIRREDDSRLSDSLARSSVTRAASPFVSASRSEEK